jgi:aquaporin Z
MTSKDLKAYLSEFIGTFIAVFAACGSAWAAAQPGYAAGQIVPAFGAGLAIVAAVYTMGHVSGAHFNPAVTLAVAIAGGINWLKALIYIVVQIIAGIVAALVLNLILGGTAAAQFGAFSFDPKFNSIGIVGLELVLTFIMATVVLQSVVRGKSGNLAGLVYGLSVAACILAGGAISGAALNPARSLGPAIIAGNLNQVAFYLVGSLLGGALAAIVSSYVLGMQETAEATPPKKNTGRRA